jgi:hypothetical protein
MPLMTVSMTVITVLQSAEVIHIPQELRLSLADGYPFYERNTLTHFQGVH